MAVYSVDLSQPFSVDFSPRTPAAEVIQNVKTIATLFVGSVPLDRELGMSMEFLDKPVPWSTALVQTELIQALEVFEPRAQIQSITFTGSTEIVKDGRIQATVSVSIED